MIDIAVLANGIEHEAVKGESVLGGCGHQSAEVEVHVVHERSITNTTLEALKSAGHVGEGQLEQAHPQRELHRVALDHLEATVIVSGNSFTRGQITTLDIRELEQTALRLRGEREREVKSSSNSPNPLTNLP